MREIKFRAKGIRENKDKWFVGSLFIEDGMGITYILSGVDTYYETNYLTVEVNSKTVGQFTTQTDNNGKDIYEGDILRVGSQIGTVVYDCDCFEVAFGCGNTSLFRCLLEKPCLVIGNVHDNPELLEVEA